MAQMRREALQVLYPNPKELNDRISSITQLSGRAPNLYAAYLAWVEWNLGLAIEEAVLKNEPLDERIWLILTPTRFLLEHAVSLQRKGRTEAVEIAQGAAKQKEKKSLVDRLMSLRD